MTKIEKRVLQISAAVRVAKEMGDVDAVEFLTLALNGSISRLLEVWDRGVKSTK